MCLKKVLKCRISKALQTLSFLFLDSNVVSGARSCVRCLVYVKCGSRRELGEGQRRADTVCIIKRQRKRSDSEENTNQTGVGLKDRGCRSRCHAANAFLLLVLGSWAHRHDNAAAAACPRTSLTPPKLLINVSRPAASGTRGERAEM